MRAILADSGGHNLDLLIAEQIVYNVGFFGLLYSAYNLIRDRCVPSHFCLGLCCEYVDRQLASHVPLDGGILTRITTNRSLYRLALTVAVALGIVGTSKELQSNNPNSIKLGNNLRKASIIIFLVLTVLLALLTLRFARKEISGMHLMNFWDRRLTCLKLPMTPNTANEERTRPVKEKWEASPLGQPMAPSYSLPSYYFCS